MAYAQAAAVVTMVAFKVLAFLGAEVPTDSKMGACLAKLPCFRGTKDVEIGNKDQTLRLDAVVVHARKVPPIWQRLRPSGMGVRFLEPADKAEGLRALVGKTASSIW